MTLRDCLQTGIEGGDLNRDRARAAQVLFDKRMLAHASAGDAAADLAAQDVLAILTRDHAIRNRQTLMQADRNMKNVAAMVAHRDSDGNPSASSFLRQLIEWGSSATMSSVASRARVLADSYFRDIGAFIDQHSRSMLRGVVRNKALLRDIVRELHGEATGQPRAKLMAEAVGAVLDRARREFNAAGGTIAKLEGWALPHHWDRRKVAGVSADDWAMGLHDRINWEKTVDHATGLSFAQSSREARLEFLRDIHETIVNGGWNRRKASGQRTGRSLANSRSDHRVLHFGSADDWMRANDDFGSADPFAAVVEHLERMARDTAQMQILGPNPRAGMEFLIQSAKILAAERPWKLSHPLTAGKLKYAYSSIHDEVDAVGEQARRMLDMVSGANNKAEADQFARFMGGVRHVLVASQLGGAMLSAVGDTGFMAMAARHVGMSQGRLMRRFLKTLLLPENRRQLKRAGIIAESAAHAGVSMARMFGEAYGHASAAQLSEFTLRASGLTAWTDIARGTFKLEFYGHLADNAHLPLNEVDTWLRRHVLEARGITAEEWDIIRQTALYRDEAQPDASFLIPDDIRRRADLDPDQALDLSLKLAGAIREQMEFAVPTVSLRARAALPIPPAGTISGELGRSTFMYKNYALTLMFNQMGRVAFHDVRGSRMGNVLRFALVTMLGGAVSLQLKDTLLKGRDPRQMFDPDSPETLWLDPQFLKAAALQGGGLGIFGDFIYATENRFGGGLAATAMGPVVGLLDRSLSLTGRIGEALISGDADKIDTAQREAVRFFNQFGGPTNLWYLNLALDRGLWDGLTEWLDPGARQDFARAEKKWVKDYGNRSWAPQGRSPRLPDPSSLWGYDRP